MDDSSAPNELRDRFPGYFPPDDDQLRDFITRGLLAFDTNALLDVYRLNDRAREEYLAALRKLGDRLWIPNRVGQELLDRRLTVIKECSSATDRLARDLGQMFDSIAQLLREFGNRRGLPKKQVAELVELTTQARNTITKRASDFYTFHLDPDKALKGDPILSELENVLNHKIGPPLTDLREAKTEGKRRIDDRVPPGYADAKKDADRAIGDYLLWRQLQIEATRRKLPVVLVSNDQKGDWVREEQGKKLGPRPELVLEMRQNSNVAFHMITVRSFLVHARKFLGATVSEDTVLEARTLDDEFSKLPSVAQLLTKLESESDQSWARRMIVDLNRAEDDYETCRSAVEGISIRLDLLLELKDQAPTSEWLSKQIKEAKLAQEYALSKQAAARNRYLTARREYAFLLEKD